MNIDPVTAAVGAVAGWFVLRRLLNRGRASPAAVRQHLEAGAQVLDVRSPEEFRAGAYPGALSIPLDDLERRLGELEKGRAVVVYCASGGRSRLGAQLLRRAGFAEVLDAGGLFGLLKAGRGG